jgi:hypothetical protein
MVEPRVAFICARRYSDIVALPPKHTTMRRLTQADLLFSLKGTVSVSIGPAGEQHSLARYPERFI